MGRAAQGQPPVARILWRPGTGSDGAGSQSAALRTPSPGAVGAALGPPGRLQRLYAIVGRAGRAPPQRHQDNDDHHRGSVATPTRSGRDPCAPSGLPALQLNAFANSGSVEGGPIARNCESGCGLVFIRSFESSGRMLAAHTRAHARKKRWSPVRPSIGAGAGLPARVAWYAGTRSPRPPRSAVASPRTSLPLTCWPSYTYESYWSSTHLERCLVVLQVLGRPPVAHVALRVELAALVVEPVRHLVADDGAHRAVVDGVVRLRVEEGRLQDAGGKHDLVHLRVVVRVDRRRRHLPVRLVDGLADLRAGRA